MVAISFLFCRVFDHLISKTAPSGMHMKSVLASCLVWLNAANEAECLINVRMRRNKVSKVV